MAVRHFDPTVQLDNGLIIPASAAAGRVLTSDAEGNATWKSLVWEAMESYHANLEQTVLIRWALFNGLVFLRGQGKIITTEIASKGIFFTMPAAARPGANRALLLNNNQSTTTQTLIFKTNGEVECIGLNTVGKTPTFDGMVYSL